MKTILDRFEEKYIKTDYCWVWKASICTSKRGGYGRFRFDNKIQQAHRI